MQAIWDRIKAEPAVVAMLINQIILFGAAFGLSLSAQQIVEINALVAVLLTFITRQTVAPVSKMTVAEVKAVSERPPSGVPPTNWKET